MNTTTEELAKRLRESCPATQDMISTEICDNYTEAADALEALAARVVALETALGGVLSVADIPQSGPTICMSAEDAINSAANGLDLQLAVLGARAILEKNKE